MIGISKSSSSRNTTDSSQLPSDTKEETMEVYTELYQDGKARLRMSRSFGDFYLKQNSLLGADQQAVVAVPEITIHRRCSRSVILMTSFYF